MRGDSLQDLYSKSLALVGLGVLACIGALVDYWPARLDPPRINARDAAPLIAAAHPVRAVHIPMPVLARARNASPAPAGLPPAVELEAPELALPVTGGTIDASLASVADFGAPPAAPLSSTLAMATPDPFALIPGSDLYFDEGTFSRMAAAVEPADDGDGGGFFSSATGLAKKAGSSLITTGTRAGASIMDGLSFVGRKIKKLKFF